MCVRYYLCKIWVLLRTRHLCPSEGTAGSHRSRLPWPNAAPFLKCLSNAVCPGVIIFNEKMPAEAATGHLVPSCPGRKRITLSEAEGFYYHIVNEQWPLSIQRDSEGPGRGSCCGGRLSSDKTDFYEPPAPTSLFLFYFASFTSQHNNAIKTPKQEADNPLETTRPPHYWQAVRLLSHRWPLEF